MDKKNLIWLALGGLAAYLIFFRKPKSDNAKNISQPDVVPTPTPTPTPTNAAPARERPAMMPTERDILTRIGGKFPRKVNFESEALQNAVLSKYKLGSVPNKGDRIETDYGVYEFKLDKASPSLALNSKSWNKISEKKRNTASDVIGM